MGMQVDETQKMAKSLKCKRLGVVESPADGAWPYEVHDLKLAPRG